MLPRFYAPNAGTTGSTNTVVLPGDESRHATSVLRLRVGDELAVFDGRGQEWRARIASASRSGLIAEIVERIESTPEPQVRTTLLQAILKGDHMDTVIRDATMMGVAEIWPVLTTHTVVNEKSAMAAAARTRWSRIAVASAKQCRRAVVPGLRPATALEGAVEDTAIASTDVRIVLAEPIMRSGSRDSPSDTPRTATLAVGPEGGWSSKELELFARAGFVPLTLGTLTLRADAAATVAISVLRERWKDL